MAFSQFSAAQVAKNPTQKRMERAKTRNELRKLQCRLEIKLLSSRRPILLLNVGGGHESSSRIHQSFILQKFISFLNPFPIEILSGKCNKVSFI